MTQTYGIAIYQGAGLKPLNLPPMTHSQADIACRKLRKIAPTTTLYVVNLNSL